jgi:hypothetical protein
LNTLEYDFAYYKAEPLQISDVPVSLFQPEFSKSILGDMDAEFITIARKNSFNDFVPHDSLIFVYGDNDQWVFPVNTERTYADMLKNGGKVKAYLQPGGDHETTLNLYLSVVLDRGKMYLPKTETTTK